jgi:hypothetical protein
MAFHGIAATGRSARQSDWGIEMAVTQRSGKPVKMFAAVVGGGALVALGVVGALSGGSSPATHQDIATGEMTMGGTATANYTETSIETSMAVPADKAKPFGGSGS